MKDDYEDLEFFGGCIKDVLVPIFGIPFLAAYLYYSNLYGTYDIREHSQIRENIEQYELSNKVLEAEKNILESTNEKFNLMDVNNNGLVDITEHLCYELSIGKNSSFEHNRIASKNLYQKYCNNQGETK